MNLNIIMDLRKKHRVNIKHSTFPKYQNIKVLAFRDATRYEAKVILLNPKLHCLNK